MRKIGIRSLMISCLIILVCFGFSACKRKDNESMYTLNIYIGDDLYKSVELKESEVELYELPTVDIIKDDLYYFYGWVGDITDGKVVAYANKNTLEVKAKYNPIFLVSEDGELSIDENNITKSLTEITIPASFNGVNVLSVKDYAFSWFNNLRTIVLPTSLQSIGDNAFIGCYGLMEVINLSTININVGSEDNGGVGYHAYFISNNINDRLEYQNIDGVLYTQERGLLIAIGVEDRNTKEIIVNENTDSISNWAFANCRNVEKFYFNATACYGLPTTTHSTFAIGADSKNVTLYVAANVKSIPDRLFMNSWSDEFYGNYYGATHIKNTIFANGSQCISIGDYAFEDCIYLESIEIPHHVKYIGKSAYNACVNVDVINYNAINCTTVFDDSFILEYTGDVRDVVVNIGKSVQKIPSYLFGNYCASITQINFEEGSICESIGEHAFSNTSVTKIVLPNSIKNLDNFAFGDCESLTEISLPTSLEIIGWGVFQGCESLQTINLPDSLIEISDYAFGECLISEIILPASIEKLGDIFTFSTFLEDEKIYFCGTNEQWDNVEKDCGYFGKISIYIYIETESEVPTDGKNYWHYDTDGITPVAW